MTKIVRLGNRLRYPITVVKLLKAPGDKIKKQELLMEFSFKWMREVGDSIRGETWQQEQTTITGWNSPADGELTHWLIREGQHITADKGVMEIKEECPHSIQFQGLCGICGKDMTEVNWAAETRDTARAPISMVHDQTNLTVSATQAQRTEQELQRRLLQSRKLSLVVDLDQTIIQACIDPTVGEWQRDPTNPNHESVKNIKSFQLDDGPSDLARRCSYYIKMRPGLEDFLKRISEMYELHVYTMGTRAYAQNVARVVDPDKKLFGNRVISRDENGNIFSKNLQRLFPVSTHMVVIIDDRSDVWPRNRPNLIKVSPYEFFKGIGDINSSFLPKRQDLLTSDATPNGVSKKEKTTAPAAKSGKNGATTADALVNMAGEDDPTLTKMQVEEQERAFEKQINDRPLQVLQEKLDREDEEAEKATVLSEASADSRSSSPPSHRHHVLQDDDEELRYLEEHLASLHNTYYTEYDANRALHNANTNVDLTSVPDAGRILDELKAKVLQGTKIVLSGVLPRGIDIYRSEIGLQIMSFGAELRPKVTRDVTHLVVNTAQPGREKLLEARRRPHIKIVSQEWLATCFSQWQAVDETPYLFTARLAEEDDPNHKLALSDEDGESEAETEAKPNGRPTLKPLRISARSPGDEGDIEPGLLPSDVPDGQLSPIDGLKTFNWGSADEELAEFLAGSSDDEDDEEDEDYMQPDEAAEEESSSDEDEEEEESRGRARRSRSASAGRGAGGDRKRKGRGG
jgi:RNA polymerase II subunit A-like phosphatase